MTFPDEPRKPTAPEPARAVEQRGEAHGMGQLARREVGPATGPSLNSAFAAGLDRELHGRAEAAIAAFRLSFDAALAEGSPGVRQRLRQAASDLMRVAARTTIVLDRLNASAEREAVPAPNHARWSQGR